MSTGAEPPRPSESVANRALHLTPTNQTSAARRGRQRFAALVRWLHIYISMFCFGAVLFFSVTGLTLNHPSWFASGAEDRTTTKGHLDRAWLAPRAAVGADSAPGEAAASDQVDKNAIVGFLQRQHDIHGELSDFTVDEQQCVVAFKGPGCTADVFIDRSSGDYELTQASLGVVAVINDLHKGRDAGRAWSALIDVSSMVMAIVSLTGFVLLFFIKRRRASGLVVGLIGAAVLVVIFWMFVPRSF